MKKIWKKLGNLKFHQLEAYLESQIYVENNTIFYLKPVSFNNLVTNLHLDAKSSLIKLQKINPNFTNQNLPLSEVDMQTFLLELNFDFHRYQPINFCEKLQKFADPDLKPVYVKRPLVVTVMGHVDHGKTTLLDTLRNSKLVAKEKGSITQKIGGYKVIYKNNIITFLDTPGHKLFSEMRVRGAQITDLVVLIVSGSEGIKEQTIEAINQIKKSQLPVVVFVNKMDLPTSNFSRVEKKLAQYHLISTQLGGDTAMVSGSALHKKGITELLSKILETGFKNLNLNANISALGKGVVVDSALHQKGVQIAVLVQQGVFKVQDYFFVNGLMGKIKTLENDTGNKLSQVLSGEFVFLSGINQTLPSGSTIYLFPNEKIIKTLIKNFQEKVNLTKLTTDNFSQKELLKKFLKTLPKNSKKINLILKFNHKGAEETFRKQMVKFLHKSENNDRKKELNFLKISTGVLSSNDFYLAAANQAIILTFGLRISSSFQKLADEKAIKVKNFEVFYDFLEHLEKIEKGEEFSLFNEKILGIAKILKIFHHSKYGKVAGCVITKGTISLNKMKFKVMRQEKEIAKNLRIKSLKQEKHDIVAISVPQECGIIFFDFSNFAIGDLLIQYDLVK